MLRKVYSLKCPYELYRLEAKRMLDGKNFFEIQEMVKNDDRFSFGCLDGSEGEGRIDLNYKGVLITIEAVCKVLDNYEKYDEHGNYIGLSQTI